VKLSTKGLLVVSFPLIFQLIIVSVLAVLLWQAQNLAAREARAKDIIAECNRVATNIGSTMQSVFSSNSQPGSLTRPLEQSDFDFIRTSVQALQQKLLDQPEEAKNVQRLSQFTEKFIRQLKAAKDAGDPAKTDLHASQDLLQLKLFITGGHLFDIFNNMIAIENQTHPEQPKQREQGRLVIRLWLLAAVGFSALAALGLAYFSSMTIRKPLERMVKNAQRISQRQELEPLMDGNDELANLDRVLHSVNLAIEEALTSERNLISYAADLVFSIDRSGIFQSVNPYSKTMLGFEHEQLIGTSVLLLIPKEDRETATQYFSSYDKENETLSFEIKMQKRDQEVIDTSWSAIWSQREDSFFCVAHDVTERKHVERLKQDFIAMISHDLRTPLMSVLSSINLVQSGATGEISAPVESELNSAERSVDHLIELVNDLLDFEKLEAGRMDFDIVPIQISEVVNESVRMVRALSDQRKVTIESSIKDFAVAGDQRKLIQVLVNLLSNALKHSPEGGLIKVQTSLVDKMLELSVHDQGPGVPDQFVDKIFAPFEQISDRSTAALGTGLGLAICKLLVEGHGGEIGVRSSRLLNGSAFWFTVEAT
jgi:PAS domain S-box-containing protein